eukprot:Opistho-2@70152
MASSAVLDVEGDMAPPEQTEEDDHLDTLDEPVSVTIKRDALMVAKKFLQILSPRADKRILHDWDLWGPLILCVTLAMILRESASESQKSLVFSGVFVIVWCGAGVVTLNSKLLGGNINFFQSVCVLGYCIFPLTISAVLGDIAASVFQFAWMRFTVVGVGFAWSIFASIGFLGGSQPQNRKALAVYPIVLFYFVIAWLIVVQPRTH